MQRRKFGREFELKALRLIRKRGVNVAQAARDPDLHATVLHRRVKQVAADPQHAFPGQGQMRPERAEIDRLRAGHDILIGSRVRSSCRHRP